MTIWVINAALSRNVPWLSGKVPLLIPIHIVPLTESPVNIHSWAVLLWGGLSGVKVCLSKDSRMLHF